MGAAIVHASVVSPRQNRSVDGQISLGTRPWTQLQWSGNCATAALVRYLHTHGEIVQSSQLDAQGYPLAPPLHSGVNATLSELGLTTLQMNRTIARSGRWGNPNDNYDGRTASVANNHMTSWDVARLLWLFADLPPAAQPRWEVAPGRPVDQAFISAPRKALLRAILADAYSGSGLVSNRTCVTARAPAAVGPPPAPGILARLADKWLDGGRLRTPLADYPYPGVVDELGPDSVGAYSVDLSPCQRAAEVVYLNKAGLTNVAASSVGIVRGLSGPGRHFQRHYIVSFFSSLGSRFADEAAMKAVGLGRDAHRVTHLGTTQAIPTLGANLDAWLALWLED